MIWKDETCPTFQLATRSPSPESNHQLENKGEEPYEINGSHSGDCNTNQAVKLTEKNTTTHQQTEISPSNRANKSTKKTNHPQHEPKELLRFEHVWGKGFCDFSEEEISEEFSKLSTTPPKDNLDREWDELYTSKGAPAAFEPKPKTPTDEEINAEATSENPYVEEEYYRKHRSLSIRTFHKHKAECEKHLERKKKKLRPFGDESPCPDSYSLPNFSTYEGMKWTDLTLEPVTQKTDDDKRENKRNDRRVRNLYERSLRNLTLYGHRKMILYVTITLLLSSTSAFQTFVCNCKNPIKTEHLRLQDNDCPAILEPAQKNVEYTLWTNRRSGIKFQGTICGRWTKIKHITTDFFGQKIIVPETIALDTSVEDCNIMGKLKKCENRQMHFVDGKWTLNTEPPTSGTWFSTVSLSVINCALEDIMLIRQGDDNIIDTPLGKANVSTALIHTTILLLYGSERASQTQ
ncbi:hypothetical protein OUZ56_024362 [Daphnia magna]|uniref:Uncharacterized protein n=1 Tax=Daphnia magna TaxID=35525 RepID=A0ABR0B0M3_9CRUS|nr:hypothetical protein OUZ56_024362 [Daphnia magna]